MVGATQALTLTAGTKYCFGLSAEIILKEIVQAQSQVKNTNHISKQSKVTYRITFSFFFGEYIFKKAKKKTTTLPKDSKQLQYISAAKAPKE